MAEMSRAKRVVVSLLFAAAVIVFLGACDDVQSSSESVEDYSGDYTASQSTANRAGNASARTGDDEVDGILWVAKVMDDITQAEGAFKAGRASARSDPDGAARHYDEAIRLRPEDLTYRRQRAIQAVYQADADVAREQWEQQDRIASEQGIDDEFWYWAGQFKDVEDTSRLLRDEHGTDPKNMTPGERATGVAIYTRGAQVTEKIADWYTLDGQIEKANEMMQAAGVWRAFAEQHGSP